MPRVVVVRMGLEQIRDITQYFIPVVKQVKQSTDAKIAKKSPKKIPKNIIHIFLFQILL